MILLLLLTTIVIVGLSAIALGQPRPHEIAVWSDDVERRLLRDRKLHGGW